MNLSYQKNRQALMKKSSVRRGDKKPVRRLKRSDVVKHNHADAASFSSSSEDLSVLTSSLWSALMTRSLEFPDRISFRNFRVEDGETDPDHEFHNYPVQNLNEAGPSGTADHPESTRSEASERGSFMNLLTSKGPLIDYRGSSWDFLTHEVVRRPSSSSFSDKVEEVERDVETEGRLLEGGDSSSTVSDTSPRATITAWLNGQLLGRGSFGSVYDGNSGYLVRSPGGGGIITSWLKGQLLGRGSFGSVYEGMSGDGASLLSRKFHYLNREVRHKNVFNNSKGQLQHQNIVRYRGTDKDGSNMFIFLDLVTQGSLLKVYQRYQIPDSVVSTYTRQILDGLKYLHGEGFVHRDIKCANILVDASGAVKLADFGLAEVSKLNDIKSSRGTPFWMAPEVINPKRTDGYGNSADIWSLGCTVLEMLTRKIPYCDLENPYQALCRIGKAELPDIPDTLSLQARDFIVQCLKAKPEERPTAAELLNHPFVRRHVSFSGSGSSSGSAQARESGSPVVTVCTANCG